ncbi:MULTISPECIES: S8 family serine peptidase [unclassified Myroides]|uniref:S8 family serine peptidase n=1 Tax=unclassified Myroides TaxID=2642485 RepID=UPI003D2F6E2B
MSKIKYCLTCICFLVGTSVFAQPSAIRNQLEKKYTTSESRSLLKELEETEQIRRRELLVYEGNHLTFKSEFVDEFNYFQAQRIERNAVIYFKTHNEVSRLISEVDQLANAEDPIFNQLMGQEMIVGVIDGDLAFNRQIEFSKGTHTKVKLLENWEDKVEEGATEFSTIERRRNHATHVTGTIVAQGISPRALGMAPQAEAFSYKWTNDMAKMGALGQRGILVSNHSYGIAAVDDKKQPLLSADFFGSYTTDAVNMDKIAYRYPYLQPVVAAGNDKLYATLINPTKDGMDLLLGHANAKNAIVVGAIGMGKEGDLRETDFSSTGPTNDFRIKPDIVAIGEEVFSSAYQYRYSTGEIEKDNLYAILSGTSMAAPSVSGILLLWQQWAITQNQFPYKAATMKGIMINSAEEMPFQKGPNARTGWGVINAWNGIQLLDAAKKDKAFIGEEYLQNKQQKKVQVKLTEKVNRLSFTIVWTDVEGTYQEKNFQEYSGIKQLVNDLDIRVYKDGEIYLPWRLLESFGNDPAVQGDNTVDNVERIDIDQPEIGSYDVVISHKGALVNKIQDFSLIINSDVYSGVQKIVEDFEENVQQLVAWPNPVEDVLHVEIPKTLTFAAVQATVHDRNGRLLYDVPLAGSNRQSFNLSFLSSGMYFFQLKGGGQKYQIKFIKK